MKTMGTAHAVYSDLHDCMLLEFPKGSLGTGFLGLCNCVSTALGNVQETAATLLCLA